MDKRDFAQFFQFVQKFRENIGFSPNGEGENKILDPKGQNSCPSGEATRARNFSLREFLPSNLLLKIVRICILALYYNFPLFVDENVMITNKFPTIPKIELTMHQTPNALLQSSLPQFGS